MIFDVLLWGDVPNANPGEPGAPLPTSRPARYAQAKDRNPTPPWVRMDSAELRQAIASTDAAWDAYQAAIAAADPAPKPDRDPVILKSPDGTRWQITIDDAGNIGRRRL